MVMIMEVYLNEHSKVMMEKCVADTCGVFVDGGVYVFWKVDGEGTFDCYEDFVFEVGWMWMKRV
jgi:hypothetical protein